MLMGIKIFTDDPSQYYDVNVSAHGNFLYLKQNVCLAATSQCFFAADYSYRPDQADPGYAGRVYNYVANGKCYDEQVEYDDYPDPHAGYDNYFETREDAVFHGIKCMKYYNNSGYIVFGDDTIGLFLGLRLSNGYEYLYNFTTASYVPQQLIFDPSVEASCAATSFKLPTQSAWEAACQETSGSSASSSSSVGETRKTVSSPVLRAIKLHH